MDVQKINVKFYAEDPSAVRLKDFIGIFTSWIQNTDDEDEVIYLDIADYSHIYAGPGVVLIGHRADFSMDNADNRLGLLYNRKQPLNGNNREKLLFAFRSALKACCRLEEEATLEGKLKFKGNEALFTINDRLLAPNTQETFSDIKPDLEDLLKTLYTGSDFDLNWREDPKQRFAVHLTTTTPFDVSTLLKHLEDAS